MNPLKMVQIGVLMGVIAGAVTLKLLWSANQELKAEKLFLETQISITEDNTVLLVSQLAFEQKNRISAQVALSQLRKDVPDVVYSKALPPEIQGIIDQFHSDIRP